ncbi:GNAT family N-acetyltransferase [Dactylosporangium matsuzakiense]|uniref:GNAT family acetyltransferase n=1 Tax=Dactylosporangium matsuzakiense TaxID=53360 RepID=A0A9W6KD65_9ACTN|nr:GNAT family N-acetyltransferase [Dactylosporangium matsuzakiense]UWZ45308.1 GNAT family N-acetyltransferase [Dactylosporangium matsuzakiense]GLK98716.1 GNAT family acetyltransferase [Dactylosporangium matsuzakiense]
MRTARLELRRLTADDVDNLVELDSDPEVMRYLNGGHPTPVEEIRDVALPRILAYYDRGPDYGYWAVQAGGEFLGWAFFRPHRGDGPPVSVDRSGIEIGYRLRRAAWGKGYATEVCRMLVARGFDEVGVDRVFAETMVVNTGSRRVMEKSGLRHVATFYPDWPDPIPGDEHGEVQYALTASEWADQPGR